MKALPKFRVLVADDDSAVWPLYQRALLNLGHTPLFALDRAEAARSFDEDQPQLVLVDLQAPKIEGVSLCRHVRSSARPDTYILAVTRPTTDADIQSVLDTDADDFMVKPVFIHQLETRLTLTTRNIRQRNARKYAEASLARAQWLAGIGETSLALQHEINNPLTAIIGSATLLSASDCDRTDQLEFIRTIIEQAHRIGEVVRRLAVLQNPKTVAYIRGTKMLDLSHDSTVEPEVLG